MRHINEFLKNFDKNDFIVLGVVSENFEDTFGYSLKDTEGKNLFLVADFELQETNEYFNYGKDIYAVFEITKETKKIYRGKKIIYSFFNTYKGIELTKEIQL